ncbi:mitotic checkpoint serine/threonine-protein kinase BUB1 beta [Gastrophryne carolinensis]
MAQAGEEWELCKENVQPLRQGRDMSTLQEVLSQQDSLNHHAIQQQKQAFELELRFYTGDDPLDVWDRYIKWAQQAFPQGGKESNLSPLLERAVKIFHLEKQYYDDIRYLNICLKFAHFCTEPVDLYSYLYSQGIGTQHAQLYITWAEEYEARGNYKKADSIFQDGLQHQAKPQEKLEAHHKQFQTRVSRQVLQGISDEGDTESPESSEPQRSSLVDLKARGKKKAKAPLIRVGDSIKARIPSLSSAQTAPPQQIPSQAGFAVFDENATNSVNACQPTLASQPWAALPSSRSKENEQKAGPWNSGRPARGAHQTSIQDQASSRPSFTPYVEELTEQQTVTPCKINPSLNSVLTARKPGKEEDPLQRLQSIPQGKEEMVMYCKNKVYAGIAEFSFEEIRAELHMTKVRQQNEDYLRASALRQQEMERQIEEMEKKLKESSAENTEQKTVKISQIEESSNETSTAQYRPHSEHDTVSNANDDVESVVCTASQLQSTEGLSMAHHIPPLPAINLSSTPDEPFTIYDENFGTQNSNSSQNLPPARRPLSAVTKSFVQEDVSALTDTLDGIEPLNEYAIVSGSDRNRTLSANPEDTCDFVRAAQLASTPFQKPRNEPGGSMSSSLERLPLREKTPESFHETVYPKKLSPILEASREDTPLSVSSVSFVSSGSASTLTCKTQLAQEKADLATPVSEVNEQPLVSSVTVCERKELHKSLLATKSEFLTSQQIHHENRQLPFLDEQSEVQLGSEMYMLKSETVLGEGSRIFTGVLTDLVDENLNGVAIKVDSEPVPWDFYIVQKLKMRLGEAFESNLLELSNCYLFQNGCITLYKNINCFTVQEMLKDPETVVENVVILLAYNLLSLIEKLHSVDIVHGDLRTETLLLDNRILDLPSCTEMSGFIKPTDFSYGMDMRLCPTVTTKAFPIAQTEYGQRVLGDQTSPYQVDLLGIANVIHFMIFAKNLQIHQEGSMWKIDRDVPRLWRRNFWSSFFSKILNTSKESSSCVLKDLKDEMSQLFDSSFQDDLCSYFILLENQLIV